MSAGIYTNARPTDYKCIALPKYRKQRFESNIKNADQAEPDLRFYQYRESPNLSVHRSQELHIIECLFHALLDKFHSLHRVHIGQVLTQDPHTVHGVFILQQVVAARAGTL